MQMLLLLHLAADVGCVASLLYRLAWPSLARHCSDSKAALIVLEA